jgi:periplasmic protein TonB
MSKQTKFHAWRCVLSAKNQENPNPQHVSEFAVLDCCLVDGDPIQRARARRVRRRSLIISVLFQIGVLAALILVPIFSKTERIALARVMPMPPYRHATVRRDAGIRHPEPTTDKRHLSFCPNCPVTPRTTIRGNTATTDETDGVPIGDGLPEITCSDCIGLIPNEGPPPVIPRSETPRVVRMTHLDPAMLIHRVEPVYPPLMKQIHRETTVELRAIIANDGSIESLQAVGGDPGFYQSALEAVGQWRYKPTVLNGTAVEVDTQITVIYRLSH